MIFDAPLKDITEIENTIEKTLETNAGLSVPTCIREGSFIIRFHENDPFKNRSTTKDTRCYIPLLKDHGITEIQLPWTRSDHSYQIIEKREKTIVSMIDLSLS